MNILLSFLFLLLLFFAPSQGLPADFYYGLGIYDVFNVDENFFDPGNRPPEYDDTYNLLYLSPMLNAGLGHGISMDFVEDLKWTLGQNAEDSELDFLVRNAFLTVQGGRGIIRMGLQHFRYARGLVLDNEEPGLRLDLDLGESAYINLQASVVGDSSPLSSIALGCRQDIGEKVELFMAWFRDEDDSFGAVLDKALPPYHHESQGDYFWYGLDVEHLVGDFFVSAIGVLQNGNIDLKRRGVIGKKGMDLHSFMADLEVSYNFTPFFSMGPFLYLASGDRKPLDGDMEAFIAIIPYNPRTAIFFNGGLDERFSSEAVSLGGKTVSGVVAPGMQLNVQFSDRFDFNTSVTLLYPQERPSGARDFYGFEADGTLSYHPGNDRTFFVEADYFDYGSYYTRLRNGSPDQAYKIILGMDLTF